jgi:prepilin-type N-terminal cleavage/methylation domain-containing protein
MIVNQLQKQRYPKLTGYNHGFTLVELMMAIALLTIGLGGVIAMQKVTAVSNQNAKSLAIASHIASSWLDVLQADSAQWNDADNFDGGTWLSTVGAEGSSASWFRPTYSSSRRMGPGFDALGSAVTATALAADARFCSDLRLSWLNSQTGIKRGAGLLRAEVRVYWLREGLTGLADTIPTSVCGLSMTEMNKPENQRLFHIVYLSTALKEHTSL